VYERQSVYAEACKRMVKALTERSYAYIVLITLIVFLALGAASSILQNLFADRMAQGYLMEYCLSTGAVQMVLSLLVIWIMKRNHLFYKDEFTSKTLWKGLKLGWLAYIFAGLLFSLNYMGQDKTLFVSPNPLHVLIVLFSALTTGLLEEILVRGFVLNAINVKLLGVKDGSKKAMLWSSAIFALAHFFNLVMNPNFLPVFANVIQAFMLGLYLAAIYVLSKNLIAPSIIHGLIDFASFIFYAILSPEALSKMMSSTQAGASGNLTVATFLVQIAITVPFLIAALLMMRNVEQKVPGEAA